MKDIMAKLHYILEKKIDAEIVTIIAGDGSSPRGVGSQMLVSSEGHECGTIGGGAVERQSELLSAELIATKQSIIHQYTLRKGAGEDIGMECGGDVTVYFQYIDSTDERWSRLCTELTGMIERKEKGWFIQHLDGSFPEIVTEADAASGEMYDGILAFGSVLKDGKFAMPLPIGDRAIIFGGGHCALALAPILDSVGFRVTVMDNREEFVTEERFPFAERRICGDFGKIADYIDINKDDYIVVMTSGHAHDFVVEEQILRCEPSYVGAIGSRQKTASVNERLKNAGITEDVIESIHAPIGLKIKAVTPAEIAVSIAAEMIMVRGEYAARLGEMTHSCPMQ